MFDFSESYNGFNEILNTFNLLEEYEEWKQKQESNKGEAEQNE